MAHGVGDRGVRTRRGVAYALLIAYALLMFVPVRVVGLDVVQDATRTPCAS